MAKTKISQFDANAANNTDLNSISIAEGTAPSNINNAIRELMSQLADLNLGNEVLSTLKIDNLHLDGNTIVTLDTNGDLNLTPNGTGAVTIAKVDINGGAIDGTPIGGSSASTGAFTTLSASSTANLGSSVTVSGGNIDGVIGANTPAAITGTVITANTNFAGNLTGNVTGTVDGVVGGTTPAAVTGTTITANTKFVGAIDGNVTATSGTSTFNNVTINGTLDMDSTTSQTITGLATPSGSTDAATKGYVDTEVSGLVDSAPAALNTLNELAAALGDDASFSTTVTNSIAAKLPLAGGTMTGDIDANSNTVSGLKAPSASNDATTKTYVDTADALKLNLSGGTLSGNLAMGSNKVTGLDTPTASGDATTKGYVDGILGSATAAATSASAAATSATASATSATASASSATAAASSATSAAASYDSFDDRYLGAKSSAPTVDNDGDALVTGALYFNTSSNQLFIWSGSAWTQAAFTASGFLSGSNNLSDVDNAGTARTNLGLAIGTNVQAFDADLSALAGLTSAADKGIQFTGSGTAGTYDLTSAGKALLDDADAAAQRTTLGLGSAATLTAGTSANNAVQLDGSAKLPAVDGSQLTNIASAEATLTKTFLTNEQSTISLSDNVVAPVVSVTKEVAQSGQTNNVWDVNSTDENYTLLNSATATTLDFVAFDVSTASFSQDFSVASQETLPTSIAFNTDGTKMFIVGYLGDDVNEYALSTGFDTSTASYTQNFSASSQESTIEGIAFNNDGTKMFIVGSNGDDVNEYALSTGFDVSTASYTRNFSVSSQDANPKDIAFNSDGTKMFIVGDDGNDVNEYALTTGFNVSTASFTDSFSVASQEDEPQGIAFNADGTKMFICGFKSSQSVNEYTLSTGFDVSTASYTQKFGVSSTAGSAPTGIAFNTDGTKMFIVSYDTDKVHEYDLPPTSVSLGSGSFASADVGKTIEANSGKFILTATSGSITQTTVPTSYSQVASGSWEMYAVVYNTTDGDLELSHLNTGFDLSNASYSQNFSVSSQDSTPQDVIFNNDGTKMFVLGDTNNDIFEYNLSTGFDVSTASYSQNFSLDSQETQPFGVAFNTDGTKMFVVGAGGYVIYYSLSTGFDVSTLSYQSPFNLSSQTSYPTGITFNTDGTSMFIVTSNEDKVFQYTLTTGFDISTASYSSKSFSTSSQDSGPTGVCFNTDGTKMFVVGYPSDTVWQYTLTTGFDVSTASYSNKSISVSSQDTFPSSVVFNTDGTKMFVAGRDGSDINEYTVGAVSIPSGYHAVHTTNSTDSTYWTDINSMTADEAAGDGTVHYCVSTDDRAIWKIAHNTSGIRSIVRNNSGTWQYNSNATYGSETWTNGATNTELATLQEAMGTSVNRMNKTQLDAVADANHFTLGNDLDLGIIFNSSGTTVPSSDGVSINYDANVLNKGAILGTDYDFDAPAQNKVRITSLASNNLKIRVV
jgi:DNA-binding beta-propeller fold protein YncE